MVQNFDNVTCRVGSTTPFSASIRCGLSLEVVILVKNMYIIQPQVGAGEGIQ